MNLSFLFEMLAMALRSFLFKSAKLAAYAKWAIRIRDYLLIFFPLEIYPANQTEDTAIDSIVHPEELAVPIEAVKKEAKKGGFNIPFIEGI